MKTYTVEEENRILLEEIKKWKNASGLEVGGDPDGVTPEKMSLYWIKIEKENEILKGILNTISALAGEVPVEKNEKIITATKNPSGW